MTFYELPGRISDRIRAGEIDADWTLTRVETDNDVIGPGHPAYDQHEGHAWPLRGIS
jgi:uncharacterized protein YgfB (UPF0149 family)